MIGIELIIITDKLQSEKLYWTHWKHLCQQVSYFLFKLNTGCICEIPIVTIGGFQWAFWLVVCLSFLDYVVRVKQRCEIAHICFGVQSQLMQVITDSQRLLFLKFELTTAGIFDPRIVFFLSNDPIVPVCMFLCPGSYWGLWRTLIVHSVQYIKAFITKWVQILLDYLEDTLAWLQPGKRY